MNKKSIAVALGLLAIFSSCSTDSEDGKGILQMHTLAITPSITKKTI